MYILANSTAVDGLLYMEIHIIHDSTPHPPILSPPPSPSSSHLILVIVHYVYSSYFVTVIFCHPTEKYFLVQNKYFVEREYSWTYLEIAPCYSQSPPPTDFTGPYISLDLRSLRQQQKVRWGLSVVYNNSLFTFESGIVLSLITLYINRYIVSL